MPSEEVIDIGYTPRPLQRELHAMLDKNRFNVMVIHRRFGKTVCAINHLLKRAILEEKPNPRLAYIAPTYRQAKNVAWDYLKQFSASIPGTKYHETELRCDLANGARISLLGAENPSSLRGIYLDMAVMDEVADMPANIFPEVIRPALSDRKGSCAFIGTPQGHNYFHDLWEAAARTDGWSRKMYKASETSILDEEELEAAKATMTEDQYNQEFECSWVANVPGSVYGKELQEADDAGRINSVPHQPQIKVDTHWDIGMHDSTAIWYTQSVGRGEVHVIDYYENRGEGLPHYIQELQSKPYTYGNHYGPHDLEVKEMGTGKSRREAAQSLGLTFRIVPRLPIEDGIHAARMLLPRCWFDRDNCRQGLEALRHYHRAYNERTRAFRDKPVHDWSSHSADAFRYCAIAMQEMATSDGRPLQREADMSYNPYNFAA
jgi:phage terminase large subunit